MLVFLSSWRNAFPTFPNKERLLGILKIASRWDISEARAFAIKGLEKLPSNVPDSIPMTVPEKFEIGRTYGIRPWIEETLTRLLEEPLDIYDKDPTELFKLGLPTSIFLMRSREAIEKKRRNIAACPPDLKEGVNCPAHNECQKAWTDFWFKHIAREILHPTKNLRLHAVHDRIQSVNIPNMISLCRTRTIASIKANMGFQYEITVRDSLIRKVIEVFGVMDGAQSSCFHYSHSSFP